MIRILHSVSNMDRAGIETMLMNYYRHIDRSKIQFDFLCNKKKPGAYDAEIKEMGGKIYHTPGLNPAKYPSYLKCMKKIFEENPEYKIVEAHNGALGVYALHAAKVNHILVRIFHAHGASILMLPLIVSCAFPARFILEVYLTKYIDSAKVMFLLFAAQIFYIIIKSIYVNLYKAQKKQSIYFIKLTAIIVVGFVFNVICYNFYKVKESFAVGTLLSAVCWYFLCLPDFRWIKYNAKEKLYPFIQTCAFLVCGFCFSAIPGFFIYIFEIMVVTWISFPKETRFIINEAKSKLAHLK